MFAHHIFQPGQIARKKPAHLCLLIEAAEGKVLFKQWVLFKIALFFRRQQASLLFQGDLTGFRQPCRIRRIGADKVAFCLYMAGNEVGDFFGKPELPQRAGAQQFVLYRAVAVHFGCAFVSTTEVPVIVQESREDKFGVVGMTSLCQLCRLYRVFKLAHRLPMVSLVPALAVSG